MKYIEDELTDGQKSTGQLLKELFDFSKPEPKCTVEDLKEHFEAYKKHVHQVYLMTRYLLCSPDLPFKIKDGYHKHYADCLAQIKWSSQSINEYVEEFIKMYESAGKHQGW